MAVPRVFISSTCYDLHEIRYRLYEFIKDFCYDPVMSETGDIFFNYENHVQDACIKEIEKCNMFILIIGNNYGSLYHKNLNDSIPSSVTKKEFQEALSIKIPKHIFINKFVHYDYNNYKRLLDEKYRIFFETPTELITNDLIDQKKSEIKISFDTTYPFSNKSYKLLFPFLEIIENQKENNYIVDFETFDHIQLSLKKQWAGFVYDKLTENHFVKISELDFLKEKILKIEELIKNMATAASQNQNSIIINTEILNKSIQKYSQEEIRDKVKSIMDQIIYDLEWRRGDHFRGHITQEINSTDIKVWLDNLSILVNKYKWSKYIEFKDIFSFTKSYYTRCSQEIDLNYLVELNDIYNAIPDFEKENFSSTIYSMIEKIIKVKENFIPDPWGELDPFKVI